MDSNQLIKFKAIAEHKTLTEAANSLFITQSALSHSLATLEKELGKSLFTRDSNKSLYLTADGKILLEYANAIKNLLDQADRAIRDSKSINISAVNICTAFIISKLNEDYLKNIKLIPVNQQDMTKLLFNGQLDVAISDELHMNCSHSLNPEKAIKDFTYIRKFLICKEQIGLIVTEDSPLYVRKSITLRELGKTPIAIQSSATGLQKWMEDIKRMTNYEFNVAFSIDSYSYSMMRDHIIYPELIMLNSLYNPFARIHSKKKTRFIRIDDLYSSRMIYMWFLDSNKKVEPLIESIKDYYKDHSSMNLERSK